MMKIKTYYEIFMVVGLEGKLTAANGFTGEDRWIPDISFSDYESARKALEDAYGFEEDVMFVILPVEYRYEDN